VKVCQFNYSVLTHTAEYVASLGNIHPWMGCIQLFTNDKMCQSC